MGNKEIKINTGFEFSVKSNNEVYVKNENKVFSLKGPTVSHELIPLLPKLENGITQSELMKLPNYNQLMDRVINPLLNQEMLIFDDDYNLNVNNSDDDLTVIKSKIAIISNRKIYDKFEQVLTNYFSDIQCINPFNNKGVLTRDSYELLRETIKEFDYVLIVETVHNNKYENMLNKMLCDTQITGMFIYLNKYEYEIGPTVIPGYLGCLACLKFRQINTTSNVEQLAPFLTGDVYSNITESELYKEVEEATMISAIGIVVYELRRIIITDMSIANDIIVNELPITFETVISNNLTNGEIYSYEFLKNPRCPVCGSIAKGWPENNAWMENYSFPGMESNNE